MAVAVTGLLLAGATPLDLSQPDALPRGIAAAGLVVNLGFTIVTFFKGKPVLGALGVMVPPLALIGGIRLAKPDSQWAH